MADDAQNGGNGHDRRLADPEYIDWLNAQQSVEESVADLVERYYREKGIEVTSSARRLFELRRAIERSGLPLLTPEEAEQEKLSRRLGL